MPPALNPNRIDAYADIMGWWFSAADTREPEMKYDWPNVLEVQRFLLFITKLDDFSRRPSVRGRRPSPGCAATFALFRFALPSPWPVSAYSSDDRLTEADEVHIVPNRCTRFPPRRAGRDPARRLPRAIGGICGVGGRMKRAFQHPRGGDVFGRAIVTRRGSGRRASPRSLRRNPWAGSRPYAINP